MKKAMVFLKRKEDITTEQFIEYYETKHVPLVRTIFPTIRNYIRNYIDHESYNFGKEPIAAPDGRAVHFDVVTEIWFDNQADVNAFLDAHEDDERMTRLRADELKFLDRSMMQVLFVDERFPQ